VKASHSFNADRLLGYCKSGIYEGLNRLTLEYQKNMRKTLSSKGSGKQYRGGRKRKGRLRARSSPGEPPAVDTGELRRSVTASRDFDQNQLKIRITGIKWYGIYLDNPSAGGNKPAKVAARPWIDRSKPPKDQIEKVMGAYLSRAVRRFVTDARRGVVT